MGSSLLRTTESIYIVSLLFRTLIFLPVFEWHIGITLSIHFFDSTYQRSYFLFVYLEWITTYLLIFFTHVIIVHGQISSFVINPNGQYGNVPLLHALVSGFYLVCLALLINWSNFADTRPSLATRWGGGSIQPLLRWQSLSIHITLCLLFS